MKRSLKGVIWVMLGDAGARLIGFAVTAYLARTLGPSNFGLIAIGLAVLAYLSQISGAGLQVLETRNVASGILSDSERTRTILSLRFAVAIALSVGTALVLTLSGLSPIVARVILFSTLILIPLAVSLEWFFQGKERFDLLGVSRIGASCVYGVLVLVLVHGPEDVESAILAFAGGTFAGSLFLLAAFRSEFGAPRPDIDLKGWMLVLRRSIPVTVSLLLAQSAVNLGPIVLGYFSGISEAGVFSAAMKIVVVVLILDRILNSVFLPFISRVHSTRSGEFSSLVVLAFKGTFTVVVPIAGCCFILAPWIVPIVFGDGYSDAIPHFRFLLFYVVFTLLNSVLMCSMISAGEEARYSKVLLFGSLVLVLLVVVGSAVLGPPGVSLGIGFGELVTSLLLISTVRSTLSIELSAMALRYAGALGVMAVVIALTLTWHPAVTIPLSLATFLGSVLLLRGATPGDLRHLWGKFV